MACRVGTKVDSRDGKNVYVGEVSHMHPGNDESRPLTTAVFEVTERLTDADGNFYLIPKIQIDTWWTNLSCAARVVKHAGQIKFSFGKRCTWFDLLKDIAASFG